MRFLIAALIILAFSVPAIAQRMSEDSLKVEIVDAPHDEVDIFIYKSSESARKYYKCLQEQSVDKCVDLKPRGNYSFSAVEGPHADVTFPWLPSADYLVVAYVPTEDGPVETRLITVWGDTQAVIRFGK